MSKLRDWVRTAYGWRELEVTDREVAVTVRYQPARNTLSVQPTEAELQDPATAARLLERLGVQIKVDDTWVDVTAEEAIDCLPISLVAAILQRITEVEQVPSQSVEA
jgi:hypothetical protein